MVGVQSLALWRMCEKNVFEVDFPIMAASQTSIAKSRTKNEYRASTFFNRDSGIEKAP